MSDTMKDLKPNNADFGLPSEISHAASFGDCVIPRARFEAVKERCENGEAFGSDELQKKICSEIAPLTPLSLMVCKDSHRKMSDAMKKVIDDSSKLEQEVLKLRNKDDFSDTSASLEVYRKFCSSLRGALHTEYPHLYRATSSCDREVKKVVTVSRFAMDSILEIQDYIAMKTNAPVKKVNMGASNHVPRYLGYLRRKIDIGDELRKRNKANVLRAATALASLEKDEAESILKKWESDPAFHKELKDDYELLLKKGGTAGKYGRQQASVNQPYLAMFYAFHLLKVTDKEFYNFVAICNSLCAKPYQRAVLERFISSDPIMSRIMPFISNSKDVHLPVFVPTTRRVVSFMASIFGCFHPDDKIADWKARNKQAVCPPPSLYYITNFSSESALALDLAALLWILRKKTPREAGEPDEESAFLATWLYNTTVVGHQGIFDDVFAVKGNLSSVSFQESDRD